MMESFKSFGYYLTLINCPNSIFTVFLPVIYTANNGRDRGSDLSHSRGQSTFPKVGGIRWVTKKNSKKDISKYSLEP